MSKPRNEASLLPQDAAADDVLERIRELLTDQFLTARQLAAEAAVRFPEHEGIQNAWRILSHGRSRICTGGPEPSTTEEFNWLRDPPESVRGKWVALVGSEMVASADTLAEVAERLRSLTLPKPALVHRID